MKLFTSEEEDHLFEKTRFEGESKASASDRAVWQELLNGYTAFFDTESNEYSNRLFSHADNDNGDLTAFCFYPFFRSIEAETASCSENELFKTGAFAGWKNSYLDDLKALWMPSIRVILEKVVGDIPLKDADYKEWLQKKVIPLSKKGKLFHDIAVEYPVFARQIIFFAHDQAEHIKKLISDVVEFGKTDAAVKLNIFNKKIISVSSLGSDRHDGGRTVHLLTYENGVKLVYKPHSVAIDKAFGKWVNFLSMKAGYGVFPYPDSYDFNDAGFSEFITASSLSAPSEAGIFFRNAGLLFAAVYLLKGNDMHQENIIATGVYPVSVDMETVLFPENSLSGGFCNRDHNYRVTDLSFLPTLNILPGFCCAPFDSLTSTNENCFNLPTFNGEQYSGRDYTDEICEGFSKAIALAAEYREELLKLLFEEFSDCEVRIVLQPTAFYSNLSRVLATADCIKDAGTYERVLSKIEEIDRSCNEEDKAFIIEKEKAALRRLDIPYFSYILKKRSLEFIPDWIESRKKAVHEDLAIIRWCLGRKHAYDGAGEIVDVAEELSAEVIDEDRMEGRLKGLSEIVLRTIGEDALCCYTCRENDEYRICTATKSLMPFLDGGLGSLVALGAYYKLYPDDRMLAKYRKKLADLYKPNCFAHAITTFSMGLSDGTGGFLLGSIMLYEMGYIEDDQLRMITGEIEKKLDNRLKIKYARSDLFHGTAGLYASLRRLPDKFLTEKLKLLKNALYENVLTSLYKEKSSDVMTHILKELYGNIGTDHKPVRNQSLRFGNAGKLYKLINDPDRRSYRSEEKLLISILSKSVNVLQYEVIPEGFCEAGLFAGMPGVLYSLCRAMDTDTVPIII